MAQQRAANAERDATRCALPATAKLVVPYALTLLLGDDSVELLLAQQVRAQARASLLQAPIQPAAALDRCDGSRRQSHHAQPTAFPLPTACSTRAQTAHLPPAAQRTWARAPCLARFKRMPETGVCGRCQRQRRVRQEVHAQRWR
jgi:hypothetical protein